MNEAHEDPRHATACFAKDLNKLIEYFRREFHLSYAEAIGCLDLARFNLALEAHNLDEGDRN